MPFSRLPGGCFPASRVTSSASWSRRFPLDNKVSVGLVPHQAAYDVLVTARLFVRLTTDSAGTPVNSNSSAAKWRSLTK
jgi:hypothetical protein